MATTERPVHRKPVAIIAAAAVLVIGVVIVVFSLRSPPQMGADKEVFRTVDALFTAVTGRDEQRLGQCEQRLHACLDAGTLPAGAAAYLDAVIRQARAGGWKSAAEQLYDYVRVQRRDGVDRADVAPRKDKALRKTNAP